MNTFEQLLDGLSHILGIPLHAEKGYICKLLIEGSVRVHLEHESSLGRILIASFPAEIPPGKLREDVLKEALKENSSSDRLGTFAYSSKNNSLAYFTYVPDSDSPDKIANVLSNFIETTKNWKTAIETGSLHLIQSKGEF